jgi:hypothetical protein
VSRRQAEARATSQEPPDVLLDTLADLVEHISR